jgi:DNA-binding NtrC family response regulator
MSKMKPDNRIDTALGFFLSERDNTADIDSFPTRPQSRESIRSGPGAMESMAITTESLIAAYVVTNLNHKKIPLKKFMDDCEKKILLNSLQLTCCSQRNAADLLGVKPTALFEKMRKHGINSRQFKLSKKLEALPPGGSE